MRLMKRSSRDVLRKSPIEVLADRKAVAKAGPVNAWASFFDRLKWNPQFSEYTGVYLRPVRLITAILG